MAVTAPADLRKPERPSPAGPAPDTGEPARAAPVSSSGGMPTDAAPPASDRVMLASSALTILAVLLLTFVVQLVFVSRLQHYRAQRLEYAQLRNELAQGIAPVGDVDSNGKPLKLGAPVALLEIPSIGVREVVGQGTTSGVLSKGPGHRRDTVLPGQRGISFIMGRRAAYGGPFARLRSLHVGDRITVTTGQGVQRYAVLDVREAGDPGPPGLGADESRLVLQTATGAAFVPGGLTWVDARLTSPVQQTPAVSLSPVQLPASEKALHGDPSAWLPIALWAQALLIVSLAIAWTRTRWGLWQTWLVGAPLLGALGLALSDALIRLLPNLL